METETTTRTLTTTRPPAAPDFTATDLDRREYQLAMREWWIDTAEQHMTDARHAYNTGDTLTAAVALAHAQNALSMSRIYRGES